MPPLTVFIGKRRAVVDTIRKEIDRREIKLNFAILDIKSIQIVVNFI
jgi:hypothetical protein